MLTTVRLAFVTPKALHCYTAIYTVLYTVDKTSRVIIPDRGNPGTNRTRYYFCGPCEYPKL